MFLFFINAKPVDQMGTNDCRHVINSRSNCKRSNVRQAELDKHGKTRTFHMRSDADLAFFADYRPSYCAASAQDMWLYVMLFYNEHLRG